MTTTRREGGDVRYIVKLASRRVEKEMDKLPDEIYEVIAKKIKKLSLDPRPRGVKKL